MKFIALRNDDYYIRELIAIHKDCWHLNLDLSICTLHTISYLRRRIFNSSRHPFTFSFKEKLMTEYSMPVVNQNEVITLFDSLYQNIRS